MPGRSPSRRSRSQTLPLQSRSRIRLRRRSPNPRVRRRLRARRPRASSSQKQSGSRGMRAHLRSYTTVLMISLMLAALASGQAGRRTGGEADINKERGMLLNVTAAREDGSEERVTTKEVSLYDGGQEQTIQSFTPDPSPARIVILVDNSLGLRADVEKLQKATREFAYEIYEGDQVMVVGFDQQPEIIADWTDDAKKVEAALQIGRAHV